MSHDYFAVHISLLYSQADRNIEEMLQPKHIYLQMFENLLKNIDSVRQQTYFPPFKHGTAKQLPMKTCLLSFKMHIDGMESSLTAYNCRACWALKSEWTVTLKTIANTRTTKTIDE